MNAKYVVVISKNEKQDIPMETIYIFPGFVKHSLFVNRIASRREIISAGFVSMKDGELFCHGYSESLTRESRPVQDGLLANLLFGRIA